MKVKYELVKSQAVDMFPQTHHVNVQELSALASEVRRLAKLNSGSGSRIVCGSDSRVAIGAWCKGRSSSVQLNKVLRRSMGHAVLVCLGLCLRLCA